MARTGKGSSRRPPTIAAVKAELRRYASAEQAAVLRRFFKTAPGQYGHGDRFLGIRVPQIRAMVRLFAPFAEERALTLVRSPFHEDRLAGLLFWVRSYEKGDAEVRQRIFELYLAHTGKINNWDLVDLSAPNIVGAHIKPEAPDRLLELAQSDLLWERRIAIIATLTHIRQQQFATTLAITGILLRDPHDLVHKACGWMLREVGKRDLQVLNSFLDHHAALMPRTMLRYAIERHSEMQRKHYMTGSNPALTHARTAARIYES